MGHTKKAKADLSDRKNISIREAEIQLGEEIMRHRNRGGNFSRMVRDLIHEEHERITKNINPGRPA